MVHGSVISEECIRVAYKTSADTVSDYIGKYIQETKDCSWRELRGKLEARFGEQVDAQTKLQRLRKYTQKYDQSVQMFGQFILTRASEIFSQADMKHWFIEKELVNIFTKGLRSKSIAKRVLGKDPATMDDALGLAIEATQRDTRLKAHGLLDAPSDRVEEDMEVSEVKRTEDRHTPSAGKYQNRWRDGKPACNFCGSLQHLWRKCPRRLNRMGQGKALN